MPKEPVEPETDLSLETKLFSQLRQLRRQFLETDDPAEIRKIDEGMKVLISIARANEQAKKFLKGGR